MQGFVLKVLTLLFLGLAVGLAASWNSNVQLHVAPPPIAPKMPAAGTGTTGPAPTGASAPSGPAAPTGATPAAQTGPAAPTGAAHPASAAEAYFISLPDAKKLFDSGTVIFVDARAFAEYRDGHVRGAMHLDKGRIAGSISKIRGYLQGVEVVVYCHGAECTDSEAVIKRLQALNLGIGPYHILKDGFPGWEKAGYPVDKGDEVGFQ
jgi:rhodanese-related sulfurtransferase